MRKQSAAVVATVAASAALAFAAPASAATASTRSAPQLSPWVHASPVECDIVYGDGANGHPDDSRTHAYCSGDGAVTLHVWCATTPWTEVERSAHAVVHGWVELSLGCGVFKTNRAKWTSP
ncbi:hypothetical protein OG762_15640 [Streptomyces sp. NBC_01136]|uniref:hypothetical protein n=1 Tax=unclassified Streptomyces TaxID=2593676 RepID=UPI003245ED61|nr:hypothetical protein OG762_15640 [Streptomyces sp. NBC_01136]